MKNKKDKTNLPEEDILIYDENDSIAKSRQKSRKVFVFYIVALFSVALVIILASYVVQSHQQEQLNEQINVAEGAKSRAEKVQEQMESLQKKVDKLQGELDEANKALEQAEADKKDAADSVREQRREEKALELLWQLEKAYLSGDTGQAEELIRQMDRNFGRSDLVNTSKSPLKDDAAQEYQSICDTLGVESN